MPWKRGQGLVKNDQVCVRLCVRERDSERERQREKYEAQEKVRMMREGWVRGKEREGK